MRCLGRLIAGRVGGVLLAGLALLLAVQAPAQTQSPATAGPVLVIEVKGVIGVAASGYIARGIEQAAQRNAALVAIRHFNLVVHDAATLKPLVTHKPARQEFKIYVPTASIALSPDGKAFATGGFDGGAMLWDALSWAQKARLNEADGGTTLAFSPDGSQLFVAGPDSALMLFDVASNALLSTMLAAPSGIMSLAVSPDGKLLATGEINQQVRLWKLPGMELASTIQGYAGPVLSVAYSPDGKLLASTAGGREARLLHLEDPARALTLIDHAELLFSHPI